MKTKNEIHDDAPLCRERYVVAKGFIPCDGCGEEKAIAKGTKYLEYLADDGKSRMRLCPRCLLALKFRKSSTGAPFEVHPGDFQFDKLPRRFQSAWRTLSKRLTRQLRQGRELNEAWHEVVSRLMDELGMKHLCARDYELAEQAERFGRMLAARKRSVKAAKAEANAALDRMAKARLVIKTIISNATNADAAEAMQELAAAMVDLRKTLEAL